MVKPTYDNAPDAPSRGAPTTFRARMDAFLAWMPGFKTFVDAANTHIDTQLDASETARTGAETAETNAETAQTASETAQGLAEDARDLANDYANANEDVAVGAGFSAKHFSLKSEAFKDGAETAAAAAAAAAGLPSLTGNAGKGLRVASGETSVEFAALGGLVPIAKYTVSSAVAALEFTLPATYTGFKIRILNFLPVTDGAHLYMRTSSDDGSTFDATADYDNAQFFFAPGLAESDQSTEDANQITLTNTGTGVLNTGFLNSELIVENCQAAEITQVFLRTFYLRAAARPVNLIGAATLLTANETNAIQLLFSTGNIASGEVHVYGMNDGDA